MSNLNLLVNPMGTPIAPWIIQEAAAALWLLLASFHFGQTSVTRTLSSSALLLLAASLSVGQLLVSDWGAYAAWNPQLIKWPFALHLPFTTPHKPLALPFIWGCMVGLVLPLAMTIILLIRKVVRLPFWLLSLVIAVPLFWAALVYGDLQASTHAWRSYEQTLGPVLYTDRGVVPYLWPAGLYAIWAGIMVWLALQKDEDGDGFQILIFGVYRISPKFLREAAGFIVFYLIFNVTFLIVVTIPLVAVRLLFGEPGQLVP